jgi:hypothetical protein
MYEEKNNNRRLNQDVPPAKRKYLPH